MDACQGDPVTAEAEAVQEHNSTACGGRNDSRDLLKHKCLHVHPRSPGTPAPRGVNYIAATITDRKEKRCQSHETSVQPAKKKKAPSSASNAKLSKAFNSLRACADFHSIM